MIIICKGTRNSNNIEKCNFLYNGTWGDEELVEHQKHHELLEKDDYMWLGFDIPQSFGSYSGRDGKRI